MRHGWAVGHDREPKAARDGRTATADCPRRSLLPQRCDRRVFALGHEFGANPDDERTGPSGRRFVGYRQFPAVNKRGYFLYPAIADAKDEIAKEYLDGIDAIVAKTK